MSGSEPTDQLLRSLVDRILARRADADAALADVREIYKEAKGQGLDKTALGTLVREIRASEKDGAAVQEREAILDLYREAYQRAASHTHTREGVVSWDVARSASAQAA